MFPNDNTFSNRSPRGFKSIFFDGTAICSY